MHPPTEFFDLFVQAPLCVRRYTFVCVTFSDSFMHMTWFMYLPSEFCDFSCGALHVYNITDWYVGHGSFIHVTWLMIYHLRFATTHLYAWLFQTHSYIWHDLSICRLHSATCLCGPLSVCDVTHSSTHSIRIQYAFNMHSIRIRYAFNTYSIRIQYAFNTHLIRIQYAFNTHSIRNHLRIQYVFIRGTWLIYTCDVTHNWPSACCDLLVRAAICTRRSIHTCDMPHSYMWHDSCICRLHSATCSCRPLCVCDVTHSYARRDSFIHVTWLMYLPTVFCGLLEQATEWL